MPTEPQINEANRKFVLNIFRNFHARHEVVNEVTGKFSISARNFPHQNSSL